MIPRVWAYWRSAKTQKVKGASRRARPRLKASDHIGRVQPQAPERGGREVRLVALSGPAAAPGARNRDRGLGRGL